MQHQQQAFTGDATVYSSMTWHCGVGNVPASDLLTVPACLQHLPLYGFEQCSLCCALERQAATQGLVQHDPQAP